MNPIIRRCKDALRSPMVQQVALSRIFEAGVAHDLQLSIPFWPHKCVASPSINSDTMFIVVYLD